MLIGAVVVWMDVDTVVARYNVNGYLCGKLESVDVEHLSNLGSGAIPYLDKLAECDDLRVAHRAELFLDSAFRYEIHEPEDFREWNYLTHAALSHADESFREVKSN